MGQAASKKGKTKSRENIDDDASVSTGAPPASSAASYDADGAPFAASSSQPPFASAPSSAHGAKDRLSSPIPVQGGNGNGNGNGPGPGPPGASGSRIEKKGGLSRHESPLPSPSSSSADRADNDASLGRNNHLNGSSAAAAAAAAPRSSSGPLSPPPRLIRRDSAQTQDSITSSPSSPSTTGEIQPLPNIPTTHTILANPLHIPGGPNSAGLGGFGYGTGALGSPNASGFPTSLTAGGGGGGTDKVRTFDIDDMIHRLLEAGYTGKATKSIVLKNAEITAICQAAREVFLSQPTLIELSPPVKIVGDTHGQYPDLIRLFEMCGFPPAANYLFLGDYVDRGKQSLETILLLLCYKIKYPENFFLLRGNHECANVTRVYGFYDECKRRANIKIWKTFIDVFNTLPIAAVVASKIFCVHGGLSPSLSTMDDIRRIERPTDVPDYGLLNDLLWSDPSDTAIDWEDNERGVSYCFGKAVIQQFLAQYDFDLICRAHMVVEDGYEFWNERTLVTIFSAPNYCGEFDNFGAVMSVSEDLLCAFELLKPLDGPALKKEMAKTKRRSMMAAQQMQSPPPSAGY